MRPHTNPIRRILRAASLVLATAAMAAAIPGTASAADVRLFIDPGHGGKDPGAIGGGVHEKHTNLQISALVYQAAKRQGWTVTMSRYRDTFVSLPARSRKAASFRATDFVSIHSNSMGASPRGNMTIYRNTPGRRLGGRISREINGLTPYGDLGNRRDSRGLSVLKRTRATAVVVEVLSVSSSRERRELKKRSVQSQYAEAIVKGVARNHGLRYVPPPAPKPLKKQPPAAADTQIAPQSSERPTKPPAEFAAAMDTKSSVPSARPRPKTARSQRHWVDALMSVLDG